MLVVANGCSDRTAEVASGYSWLYPEIRLIDIAEPIGKGGAVLEGFCQAAGDRLAFVDADGATAAESLLDLLARLRRCDIAIGSRWMKDSVIRRKQPLRRRAFGRLFNATVRGLFALPYYDTQCGAKAFRRAAARQLAGVVQEARWTFDVDLLLWARFFDMTVNEVPIVWEDKAGSRLKVSATIREVAAALWAMKRRDMQSLVNSRPAFQSEELGA
jgi:glycosyltransferase involved in cell wall biosynthesis